MTFALLSFLTLDVLDNVWKGPFICLVPLPIAIIYFWKYTDSKFKKKMDLSFRLAKQRDHRNKQLQEANRPIPINLFKKHFYRQPVLTDGPLYPEPYRKIDPVDSSSSDAISDIEGGGVDSSSSHPISQSSTGASAVFSPLHEPSQPQPIPQQDPDEDLARETDARTYVHPHQSQFETRMRASSMDMHRVEDEVEDPPVVLERYFREYVLPLTDPDYQAPPPPPPVNAKTSIRRNSKSAF